MNSMYVAEWNSNGTNDLIITDENGQILVVLFECLFGFRVQPDARIDDHLVVLDENITAVKMQDVEDYALSLVEPIDIIAVQQHIASSPVHPNGDAILETLKAYGLVG